MSKKTLPLRFRVLHYAAQVKEFNVNDLLRDLKSEYAGEGQFTYKMLSHHCDSLRAVGMVEARDVDINPDGTLLITYVLTEYGRTRLSYLPEEWK